MVYGLNIWWLDALLAKTLRSILKVLWLFSLGCEKITVDYVPTVFTVM